MIATNKKYQKLLNNLLDIKGRDKTIFTQINDKTLFDVTTKFGQATSKKLITQKTITNFQLIEKDLETLLAILKKEQDPEIIIQAYEKYKVRISNVNKELLKIPATFLQTKSTIQEKLEEQIQKVTTRWKQFNRRTLDMNIQDNIWPLHIATGFISIATSRRNIYAPLFLKEVRLNIKGTKISISTDAENTWKLNGKLAFLLKDADFVIEEQDEDKFEINDCLNFIKETFNHEITLEFLTHEFENIKANTIKSPVVKFHSGIVLGLFKPSGGHLRKKMLELIEEDAIDDIIEAEPDKTTYKNRISNFVKTNSSNLIYIQPANYSQKKALISSLMQDTVIWGPPGTGKSQVIANIIANIFYKQKSAVVMSQKKAALDVLKNRLGKVAPFALFILNDSKMNKAEFYIPLQKFINSIENTDTLFDQNDFSPHEIITENEIHALDSIHEAKSNQSYDSSLNIVEEEKFSHNNFAHLSDLFKLDPKYTYPANNTISRVKEYTKTLATQNNIIPKQFLFFKWFPKQFKLISNSAFNLLNNNIDINHYKTFISKTSFATTSNLFEVPKQLTSTDSYEDQQSYLVYFLATKIIERITEWGKRLTKNSTDYDRKNKEKYKQYKSFRAGIVAGRALPYKFINKHINIIRELFPIIIATPETSFINWEKESFDYAVLDETSQIFLEIGLPILHLAKTKVMAGDQKQLAPARWFATRDDSIDEDEDIPENAESLLDYVINKGVYQVMLDQNYRSSSAALMSFSAKEFYDSKLEVADNINRKEKQSIEVINVNGKWDKSINQVEAKKVILLAKENLEKYEKIIILTFNSNQRQLIEKNILESEPTLDNALNEESLLIRNIENVQGDEADLIIISVVYDPTTNVGSTYVARPGGKKALNVSISRAKEKMIVVKSLNHNTIKTAKSDDFKAFKDWLEFLDLPYEKQKSYSNKDESLNHVTDSYGETESGFEQNVVEEIESNLLLKNKYELVKQYEVGSKRIDIAFVNSKTKQYVLGVEVDGYKYHHGPDKYLQDQSRQAFLESKGYNIFRIKEIDWRIQKTKVLDQLKVLLDNYKPPKTITRKPIKVSRVLAKNNDKKINKYK